VATPYRLQLDACLHLHALVYFFSIGYCSTSLC
jgi:hypothetical protein